MRYSIERRLIILFILTILILVTAVFRRDTDARTAVVTTTLSPSEQAILLLQSRLEQNPNDAATYAQLGLAYLQRVRQTADPQLYRLSEQAFNESLTRDAQQVDALLGQGMLALARHNFPAALQWGQQAKTLNPYRAQILGVLVDAYTELGQYEPALATTQAMVDLRPDLASYSRVSYQRELHGDVTGAIEAMTSAVAMAPADSEEWAWTQVQLGNLYLNQGQLDEAKAVYEECLYYQANYAYALAGLARIEAAQGAYQAAIERLQPLVERLPLPEFAILLGDLYTTTQQPEAAQQQYDLVRLIQQLNARAGMSVDLELALFEADYGQADVALAKAREAYERRPSVVAADVLGWALYQHGDYEEAWIYAQKALRLGTQDALWHYHAAKIAYALGDTNEARTYLVKALAINPAFSIRYTPDAQTMLTNYSAP